MLILWGLGVNFYAYIYKTGITRECVFFVPLPNNFQNQRTNYCEISNTGLLNAKIPSFLIFKIMYKGNFISSVIHVCVP